MQVAANTTSPIFTITNLPGICSFGQSNIVVIEFEAVVKPQISGSKTNNAIMNTSPALIAVANYTIDKAQTKLLFPSLQKRKINNK